MVYQNYKKVVEDLVQVGSSQEKELAKKSTLVADLQKQLENSGNFRLHFISLTSCCTVVLADQYCLLFPPCRCCQAEVHSRGGGKGSCHCDGGVANATPEITDRKHPP
jgi:hypothetical protein